MKLVYLEDEIVKFQTIKKQLSDSDIFMVYMEQIYNRGEKSMKPVDSNIYRVYYTDSEVSPIPHVRHYNNLERAELGFKEAVDFNGWLGLKK